VPALHHLLEGRLEQADGKFLDPSHPTWDERDQRLQKLYVAAGREYDRLWPERYASPGGNSPVVVYAGLPSAKRGAAGELEVLIPLHCQNLTGSVEVVLRFTVPGSEFPTELRQFGDRNQLGLHARHGSHQVDRQQATDFAPGALDVGAGPDAVIERARRE